MTPEQKARDLLERMEVNGAQNFSAGEIVELANLIDDADTLRAELSELRNCAVLSDQENELLRAIAEKSIETIEWQRREKETLRQLVREAYSWSDHEWEEWHERAEKALGPTVSPPPLLPPPSP